MENYKLNRYSRQLLVLYFSSTQISIVIEKIVYFKLREAKYSSSIVLASNGLFPTKLILEFKAYSSTKCSSSIVLASNG